jgi:septum formation protein
LASASAARLRLLRAAGVVFECEPPNLDETEIKADMAATGADATELAGALAQAKASLVASRRPGLAVIGADQVLEYAGQCFDKPGNRDEARRHLRMLGGRTHRLVSGVCVVSDGNILWSHAETARLTMRPFSEEFLEAYLDTVEPGTWDSVGGYRLEGMGAQLFERIDGDHFTIQGLPLLPLLRFLRRKGMILD